MKISARINEQFHISKGDLQTLITYSRWLNNADKYDPNFTIEDSDILENNAMSILATTFGDRDGYIPGEWLDDYASDIGIDTSKWKRCCADIDLG